MSPTIDSMTQSSSPSSKSRKGSVRTAKPRSFGGAVGGFFGAIVMSVIAGVLLTAAVTPVVALSGIAANSAISIFENLPNHLNPGQLALPSTLYARQGDSTVKVAEFYAQDREMVGWDGISQYVKDAAVATEDPRFYTHGGVDVLGTGRAVLGEVSGNDAGGASTISMQYVRNVLIQQAEAIPDETERDAAYKEATRRDLDRKLKEMRYAISIEKEYSKDEILLGYLNIALFGRQIYGIESAAQYYYNTSAKDLTLSQAASLVGIVQNPSRFQLDIPENLEASENRRNYVLERMLDAGRITQAQYEEAVATPIEPVITPRVAGCAVAEQTLGIGHFCNFVQRYIENDTSFGNTPEERSFQFLRGGYQIMTTIDLDIQAAGVEAMRAKVPSLMDGIDVGGASVSVEVGTGRVLAMVQNRPFANDPDFLAANPGYTAINYNTDFDYGGSGGFQVGSTFKPITLAEWLRTGHSVRDIVNVDGRTVQENSFKASCMDGGVYGYGSFKFSNDNLGTRGNQPVLTAIAQSVNGGLVSMAQKMDLCGIFTTAENLGIHRAAPQPNEGLPTYGTTHLTMVPSNVYGGIDEIAPISMATAYAAFAGNGEVCTPVPIDSITGPDGAEVPFTKSKCKSGVSPDVAAGVAYALEYTVNNGLARHARSAIGVPHLAKTGTTDDVVDNWTVGASTKVATATWVGNVTGKVSTMQFGGWGGLMVADQTIWPAMMNVADSKFGGDAFPTPSESALKQTMTTVPDVSGRSYEEASQLLTAAGFTVVDGGEEDSVIAAGMVSSTNPAGGSSVPAGIGVTVYRSNASMTKLPDVVGQGYDQARTALNSAGFASVVGQCQSGPSATPANADPVLSSSPAAGTDAKRSSQVTLVVDC